MPIFLQDWWLDTVCTNGGWDVCLHQAKDGKILAVLPYVVLHRLGQKQIGKPLLTPFLGVWAPDWIHSDRLHKRYAFQDKCVAGLIEQLPKATATSVYCGPHFQNWMAFHQKGFRQTEAYTYILDQLDDVAALFQQLKGSVRNKIRKAEKSLSVELPHSIETFYAVNRKTFQRQGLKTPYSLAFLNRLDKVLAERQQRMIFLAKDAEGRVHAGLYLIWDHTTAYNLLLGADPALRNSGAVQLLLWEAIRCSAHLGKVFNFEGSMLPQVESIFRDFGARRQPYYRLYKERSRFWQAIRIALNK
ncbi:MAG: GNAT family N-acetyltransferase [Bacteroidota bacterium]